MSLTKVSYSMITGSPVNVLDFGAIGDGVNDDTNALQAAIDYVGTISGTLIIPPGLYKTTTTLYIDKSYVIIYGDGNPSAGVGASVPLPGYVTSGPVIQYTGTTTAVQVCNSRSVNPMTDPSSPGFIGGIQIHNLRIEVPADCQKALYVVHAANSYFFNIQMWGAQSTGGVPNGGALLYVEAGIDNIYEKIEVLGIGSYVTNVPDYSYYANFGAVLSLGFANELATTTVFRRCYFHYCNVGVSLSYIFQFEDCIFESCKQGISCQNDIISNFNRCWWEANIEYDIVFANSRISISNSRFGTPNRQQFFSNSGGVIQLEFNNVDFVTLNANPFIFGVDPAGGNIFAPSGSTPKTILFNNCSFPINTSMGNINNNSTINKIQIQNMQQATLTFTAAAVGASATPAMTGPSGFQTYTVQEDGDFIGINIFGSAVIAAGTYNIEVLKNGVSVPKLSFPQFPIQSSFPSVARILPLEASFAKGDVIGVYFNTSAGFSPLTDICFEVIVAYGPSGEQI